MTLFQRLYWALARAARLRRRVSCRGVSFTLSCENPITYYRWESFESKEPETLEWIDARVRDGDTLFDIGANVGIYSLYAVRRHPRLRALAFEPEFANLHVLRDNAVHNAVQDRLEVYGIGLGDRTGLSRLHLQDLTPGAALHTESDGPLTKTVYGQPVIGWEGIWSARLDDFCAARRLWPQAVKIDVDGTEDKILLGGREMFKRPDFRTVLIESGTGQRTVCNRLLQDMGFRCDSQRSANQIWIKEG